MEFNAIQVLLVFIVGFICGIDQFSFLESLYQPIVTGAVIGLILGDVQTGLIIGGIMAAVLGISMKVDANTAVGLAIPFSLLGQYGVTLIFTIMSPVMTKADACAHNADPKGIERINTLAMVALGLVFGIICALFFIGGATFGTVISAAIPAWLMTGLSAAGGMMRFVGFAILLKVMISGELWGFYFMGFAAANIVVANTALANPALIILALIGFGIAFWDYQIQTKFKTAAPALAANGGDEEDGI